MKKKEHISFRPGADLLKEMEIVCCKKNITRTDFLKIAIKAQLEGGSIGYQLDNQLIKDDKKFQIVVSLFKEMFIQITVNSLSSMYFLYASNVLEEKDRESQMETWRITAEKGYNKIFRSVFKDEI